MVNRECAFVLSRRGACVLLFCLYLCLCTACFFPRMAGFSDEWLLPKWYLSVSVAAALVMAEAYLLYIRSKVAGLPRGRLFSAALSVAATLECLYTFGVFFYRGGTAYAGASGTFDNPAGLSLCLCLSLPFMYRFVRDCQGKALRAVGYAAICLVVAAVCLSRSRTGLLCLTAFLVMLLYARAKIRSRVKAACAVVACLCVVAFCLTRKEDSSSGRRFILERSWELISRKPWTGHGSGGFEREYMQVQGDYFARHPDSGYAWLADEVRHPLNEFVLAWVDYGVAAPCLIVLFFGFSIFRLSRRKEGFSTALACSLFALFVFACFSYPTKYPLSWLVAVAALACLLWKPLSVRLHGRFRRVYALAFGLLSIAVWTGLVVEYHYERTWSRAARCCLHGYSEQMMPVYGRLYRHYSRNPYFLYNYAAEQFYAGCFASALETARECRVYWSSYNLELLTGDICRHSGRYEEAISHYLQAGNMCPVRFAPLEGLYHAYKDSGDTRKADSVSAVIRRKKVKVPSSDVVRIKAEAGGGSD